MVYNGKTEFTKEEADDLTRLIELFNELDPKHTHEGLLNGFSIGPAKDNIIQFLGQRR